MSNLVCQMCPWNAVRKKTIYFATCAFSDDLRKNMCNLRIVRFLLMHGVNCALKVDKFDAAKQVGNFRLTCGTNCFFYVEKIDQKRLFCVCIFLSNLHNAFCSI